tara:strand:+ start:1402 stop:1959 length:558 start_codon:yes stop_codon:yes gene_type:complete
MKIHDLFSTKLFEFECNLNLSNLKKECLDFQSKTDGDVISNVGGYQGSGFENDDLNSAIADTIRTFMINSKPISTAEVYSWVNINKPGSWNKRHIHDPHDGTFLSGVFYVVVPENSGSINFYDPRPHIQTSLDMKYFSGIDGCISYNPKPNSMLIFPSWLEHDVSQNNSQEDRITIAFNLFNVKY